MATKTEQPAMPVKSMSKPFSKHRAREEQRKGQQWRKAKWVALEALRDLRAEALDSTLQSPSLEGALLYRPPSLEDIPPAPHGRRPQEDDDSDRAEAWRDQMASREAALAWRARYRQAYTQGRGNSWRKATTGAERGGLRPGSRAYPAAWDGYLTRRDMDGPSGGGWASPLGRAFRRIERDYVDTPLLSALWAYTEPFTRAESDAARTGQSVRGAHIQRVMAALRVQRSQAYAWVQVAAARLVAEMEREAFGPQHARIALQKADEEEARLWQEMAQQMTHDQVTP